MTNQKTENKKRRFYKEGQVVWSLDLKKEVTVKSINKKDLTVTVLEGGIAEHTFPLWQIDILKYSAKDKLVEIEKLPKVYFAKVKEDAVIPSKRKEDAGYDIYANLVGREVNDGSGVDVAYELLCPKGKTTLVPTGIAIALPSTHYFNTKHERGSTGKIGLSVLSGVIDSGYRGEIFIAINPLNKDVLITNVVTETEELEDVILYPYSKAICQGTIDLVPSVIVEEIPYEELKSIDSERGTSCLGASKK